MNTGTIPSAIKFNVDCVSKDPKPTTMVLTPKINAKLFRMALAIFLLSVNCNKKIRVSGACKTFDKVLMIDVVFSGRDMKLFNKEVETKNIRFAAANARKYLLPAFCLIKMIATGINTIKALII